MSRIQQAFSGQAKIAYLTAGDGGISASVEYFMALVAAGINLLEVGIPYSDPSADGQVIQMAMERALGANTTIANCLDIVRKIRAQSSVAIILFTYYNPIQANLQEFLTAAKGAGADGILIVDLPFEEADSYYHWCNCLDLAPITVVAPSTTLERMQLILAPLQRGFIYYACQKGTTGARAELPLDLSSQIAKIKQVSQLPVAIGFGVASAAMVKQILAVADGCVVGSYLVAAVAKQVTPAELTTLAKELFNVN